MLFVRAHYSALACIGAIHAGPRGETSLARQHSDKTRMTGASVRRFIATRFAVKCFPSCELSFSSSKIDFGVVTSVKKREANPNAGTRPNEIELRRLIGASVIGAPECYCMKKFLDRTRRLWRITPQGAKR